MGQTETISRKLDLNPTISIIVVNGLNSPNKRQWLSDWIKKQGPEEIPFKYKDTKRYKEWKKRCHANNNFLIINMPP